MKIRFIAITVATLVSIASAVKADPTPSLFTVALNYLLGHSDLPGRL